ncbi:MAG: YCF48-related protein, partial [Pirellulaceae bacterium]|nr:YCF48-related protein [Pirellulaceae bacterium]
MESTIDRARSYCARGRATGGCARGLSSLTIHRAALVGWLLVGWLFAAGIAFAQPDPSPPEMLEDAELTAITFLDADRGWAVGDRGVIWHTRDGGRNWQRQNSSTTCRLEAIQFLDANVGYAVGGWTQPYTHETHGVVLRTRDGGQTWQNIPGLVLPGLAHAKFFDARNGWALGDGSPLYPSGIFRTDDGARTWIPVP